MAHLPVSVWITLPSWRRLQFSRSKLVGAAAINMILYGAICVLGAIFGLVMFLWSVRIPIDRQQPMPGLVRGSFIVFIVALLIVAGRLVLKVPDSIPWKITPELSVLIGWMFLGAMFYFVYGLLQPSWKNSAGQLVGFLAYDLVLIVPFLTRLPTTPPEHKLGLIIYTIVVSYSGLLAIYYLFLHKPTRLWASKPTLMAEKSTKV
jgi:hypothetical protein